MATFALVYTGKSDTLGFSVWELRRRNKHVPFPSHQLVQDCFSRAMPKRQLMSYLREDGHCYLEFDAGTTSAERDRLMEMLDEEIVAHG